MYAPITHPVLSAEHVGVVARACLAPALDDAGAFEAAEVGEDVALGAAELDAQLVHRARHVREIEGCHDLAAQPRDPGKEAAISAPTPRGAPAAPARPRIRRCSPALSPPLPRAVVPSLVLRIVAAHRGELALRVALGKLDGQPNGRTISAMSMASASDQLRRRRNAPDDPLRIYDPVSWQSFVPYFADDLRLRIQETEKGTSPPPSTTLSVSDVGDVLVGRDRHHHEVAPPGDLGELCDGGISSRQGLAGLGPEVEDHGLAAERREPHGGRRVGEHEVGRDPVPPGVGPASAQSALQLVRR